MKKYIGIISILFFTSITPTFAHVVVKPSEVGVATFQTFTIGVPNEKDIPVKSLRLIIPEGLRSVSPNVKQGWTIQMKKVGEGESATVNEIIWNGGEVPAGQRDDFLFSAQVPATETTIQWKAYQTYQDGTVVSWDQTAAQTMSDEQKEAMEKENQGLASTTKIINDLSGPETTTTTTSSTQLSLIALALSVVALALALRKQK